MWDDLALLKARGELVLITRHNGACYVEGAYGYVGFEYDLVAAFARELGIPLRVRLMETETEMVDAIKSGKGDILAAGIPFGSRYAGMLAMGPGYLEVSSQVVGHRGNGIAIETEKDLSAYTLWMTDSSARIDDLETLRSRISEINWQVPAAHNDAALLRMVSSRALPIAVVDSSLFLMTRYNYPELKVLLDVAPPRQLAWGISPRNKRLKKIIDDWFERDDVKSLILNLKNHYLHHLQFFDYVDLMRYKRRIKDRLPIYRPLFEAAGMTHGLDWRLLAAQAYQESHWNPRAISYTGVRGMMMLTRETAGDMGLYNRLDAKGSIMAGARYLALLYDQIGSDVPEPDRTFMALSAYNMGPGHLQDARVLARRMGKSPNEWEAVRSVLPLLQEKKYYETLEYRFARGQEAVSFVDRIRIYYQMLCLSPAS
ncbi:membrane-bound lytic murein transglycosylase MltF [Desulfosarcina sp. OttesenSCG-928-A07]|nr:membrane-bound lytic murein transglycosylase MltF [Desulfosarcina sp. OttesenSCG-928-A07]